MLRRVACAAVLAVAVASCALPGGGGASPVLRIGVDLPLSGAEATVAVPALDGVRLYVAQHPTLDGFTVELVVKDDATGGTPEPPLGAINVEAFLGDPRLVAMIGPLDAAVARAEIPVAGPAGLAMVTPGTSSPCLTRDIYLPAALNATRTPVTCKDVGLASASDLRADGINNFFRLSTTDDLQGPAAADFAYTKLHLLRVATVSDGEGYGEALATSFATRFRALGGSVVGRLDLAGSPDVAAFLERVKTDGVQGIYYGGTSANHGCAVRAQMAGLFDPTEPMLGGDGIAQDPACLADAGSGAAGIYATVPLIDADGIGTAEPVIAAFKAAYPRPADYGLYSVLAYDAAAVLYDAIHRAIALNYGALPPRGNVLSQLSLTTHFNGASGIFGFDPNGDTTRRALTVFESPAAGVGAPWTVAGRVDYTATPPY